MEELGAPSRALLTQGVLRTSSGAKDMLVTWIAEMYVAPKNPRACLNGLPEELLVAIVDELPEQDLGRLSQTNKRYNRLANTRLYEYLGEYDHKKRYSIAHNPKLAELLKDASVNLDTSNCPELFRMSEAEILKLLKNSVNLYTLNIVNLGRSNLCSEDCAVEWPSLLDLMRSNVTNTEANRYSKISRIYIRCDTVRVQHLQSVFCISTLRTLALTWASQPWPMTGWTVAESSCNITTLKLYACILDSLAFAKIMSCIKALENLYYMHSTPETLSESTTETKHVWKTIGNALRPHKQSLRTLMLENLDDLDDLLGSSILNQSDTLGSLCTFTQLREVDVPLVESEDYKESEYSSSDYRSSESDSDEEYESDDFEWGAMLAEHADLDDMDEWSTDESDE
ncbi:hypothetical protein BKA63DRAFT_593951 [Paraphoma chrysanthemicola]|nr:hypothetical protein BKA63DRAFT_593951 [Paraphoma chrysanthemicola]